MSSPDEGGFSLPLSDLIAVEQLPDPEPVIPVRPPINLDLPLAPPTGYAETSLPMAPPEMSLPMAPPMAPPPIVPVIDLPPEAPSASSWSDQDDGPVAPPSAGEAGIVTLESKLAAGEAEIPLDELLLYVLQVGASDLHLSVKSPPMVRVQGDLEVVPGYRALTPRQLQESVYTILTDRQKQKFEESKELDLAYELPGAARFRVNLMQQRGSVSAVFRAIPWEIKPLEALHMPTILADFAGLPRGLVLVTGPTGSGKSTTLAAIIDRANRTRKGHIITIEDPVEFVHQHRLCLVNQREVGEDTLSFQEALKHALRQDPDIILVGEMRDLETISIAMTAAETGHLVFGTLHTSSAATTIDRVVDVFPPSQQSQIRTQLASSVQAIVCQTLCRTVDGKGRVAATEVLVATPAVRNLIREGKLQSIPSSLQTGAKYGMHTLNQDLADLVTKGLITYETAREKCSDAHELNHLLGRGDDASD